LRFNCDLIAIQSLVISYSLLFARYLAAIQCDALLLGNYFAIISGLRADLQKYLLTLFPFSICFYLPSPNAFRIKFQP
jgi:hypothetical protein